APFRVGLCAVPTSSLSRPADNHDLHDFTSQDGFETTATPEPLATGSLSMSIRKLSRMDRPILQPFAVCCTRAVSGHAPTVVPSSVMNSCLIRSPRRANEQLCRKAKPLRSLEVGHQFELRRHL